MNAKGVAAKMVGIGDNASLGIWGARFGVSPRLMSKMLSDIDKLPDYEIVKTRPGQNQNEYKVIKL